MQHEDVITTIDTHVVGTIGTSAALIDLPRMQYNVARMQHRMNTPGVKFHPHTKITKCLDVVCVQVAASAQGITVSTLKEARTFFVAGIKDILYAVGIVTTKLSRAMALCKRGCDLELVVDNVEAVHAVVGYACTHGERCEVRVEINTDGYRSGITPEQDAFLEVGRILKNGGIDVSGMMMHVSSSYDLNDRAVLAALAEQEHAGCVRAAQRLREAGVPCVAVSVGFTPTALATEHPEGVTEVRVGVYVFFDLVMHNVGVHAMDETVLSVLTTVVGHQPDKGWVIVDAGQTAMSRDRGIAKQSHDSGYGQPCTSDDTSFEGLTLIDANQEHGILTVGDGSARADLLACSPVGTKSHVLSNHACAAGTQFPEYQAVSLRGVVQTQVRFHGW